MKLVMKYQGVLHQLKVEGRDNSFPPEKTANTSCERQTPCQQSDTTYMSNVHTVKGVDEQQNRQNCTSLIATRK